MGRGRPVCVGDVGRVGHRVCGHHRRRLGRVGGRHRYGRPQGEVDGGCVPLLYFNVLLGDWQVSGEGEEKKVQPSAFPLEMLSAWPDLAVYQ